MLAASLIPIRLECYLPRLSGANEVSLFRADSLARYLLQCAWDSSVVAMDKTFVDLNVATRSCNVYPDKCRFAVLCRFWLQCSRTLGRRSAAARLLRWWVRITPGAWMYVCCECCVLSGTGLCDELITLQRSPTDFGASLCVI